MIKVSALCVYYLTIVFNTPIEYYDNEYSYYRILGNYKDFQETAILCLGEIEDKLKNNEK